MGPDGQIRDPRQLELFGTLLTELQGMKTRSGQGEQHRVALPNGVTYAGTWEEIVLQMGVAIAATDAERYIQGSARAGLLRILH